MKPSSITVAFAWSVLVVAATTASAGPISQVVVFGDSLSDTGNVFAGTLGIWPPSPPYHDGRFSDGPVWVEYWATAHGLPVPTASLTGGTNYAFGGAETGLDGVSTLGTPNLGTQLAMYLEAHEPSAEDLFIFWGGGNDFLQADQTDASVPVANLSTMISTLVAEGATNFRVLNLPPLGETPAYRGGGRQAELDALSLEFNELLSAELQRLRSLWPAVTICEHDIYGSLAGVFDDPAAYGLANVTDSALNEATGVVVDNPHEYLFFDGVHPTTVGHALIAAVPEPSALVMLTCVAAAVGIWRLRRWGRRMGGTA